MEYDHWEIIVSFAFPIIESDTELRLPNDNEVDFDTRAVERMRPALQAVVDAMGPGTRYWLTMHPGTHMIARRIAV